MTNDRMALAELLEKGSDSDLLREMIGYVAQRLMDVDVAGLVGAEHGERAESRENWRNGHRERDWYSPSTSRSSVKGNLAIRTGARAARARSGQRSRCVLSRHGVATAVSRWRHPRRVSARQRATLREDAPQEAQHRHATT